MEERIFWFDIVILKYPNFSMWVWQSVLLPFTSISEMFGEGWWQEWARTWSILKCSEFIELGNRLALDMSVHVCPFLCFLFLLWSFVSVGFWVWALHNEYNLKVLRETHGHAPSLPISLFQSLSWMAFGPSPEHFPWSCRVAHMHSTLRGHYLLILAESSQTWWGKSLMWWDVLGCQISNDFN